MSTVGIRALKQNPSQVIAEVALGQVVIVTDRGRAVAQIGPIPRSTRESLLASGRIRPRRGSLAELPAPVAGRAPIGPVLQSMRDDERY